MSSLRVADSHPACETCDNFSYASGGAMLGRGRCNLLERYVHATFLCDNHQDLQSTETTPDLRGTQRNPAARI